MGTSKGDHHGHDWQDQADAPPRQEDEEADIEGDGAIEEHGGQVVGRGSAGRAEVPPGGGQGHKAVSLRGRTHAIAEGRCEAAQEGGAHGQGPVRADQGEGVRGRIPHAGGASIDVPRWVVVLCALVMAAGTAGGGWRIIKTLGHKMVRLHPINGFVAETGSALVIIVASRACPNFCV